jgi:1-acyl-sn-glycerol-3-phosphate acyltransferase
MDATSDVAAPTLLAMAAATAEPEGVSRELPPEVPRRHSALGQWIGRMGLSLFGWKVVGTFPNLPKLVIIVAPHTSNWDFIAGFWAYLALDLHANWFAKHTLFVGPFGWLLRHFGGIPVHRDSGDARQMVDVYADAFHARERMTLALAPEGTRQKVVEWKSGFHRIAVRAGVPIIPVAIDYRLSRVIVGAPFHPSDDRERDLARIKALYAGVTPRHPHLF